MLLEDQVKDKKEALFIVMSCAAALLVWVLFMIVLMTTAEDRSNKAMADEQKARFARNNAPHPSLSVIEVSNK